MFSNYLAAALRNLVRNKFYAAINISGLGLGFAAALLIGIFVHDEFSYDRWIAGYQDVYRISFGLKLPGHGDDPMENVPGHVGPWLKLDFPEIQAVARFTRPQPDARVSVRHGEVEDAEYLRWADPALADVLPLPVIAGDLGAALRDPAGIVLTRSMARKYFGRDDPVGETLEIGRANVMTVGAVLEDLPSETHLAIDVLASGLASFSELARIDASPAPQTGETFTYIRLAPGASPRKLADALPDFLDRRMPPPRSAGVSAAHLVSYLTMLPISAIHLHPPGLNAMKPAGSRDLIAAVTVVAALIVAMAAINFINLMTARAVRRALEVGVRKVMGAERRQLILQFLGESLIYAGVAMLIGLALARLGLPGLNGLLHRSIDPAVLWGLDSAAAVIALTVIVGCIAGFYPAFVLSAFRPARVLRAAKGEAAGAGWLRQGLVTLQFAVLIALLFGTGMIYRQTRFGMDQTLRFRQDQVLLVETSCPPALADEARGIPGVLGAACAGGMLSSYTGGMMGPGPDGRQISYLTDYVDANFFPLFGITPMAGRLFEPGRAIDWDIRPRGAPGSTAIINESAVRYLGFDSPAAALGRQLPLFNREIIGVVPDFQLRSVREAVEPTAYLPGSPASFKFLSLRIAGDQLPGAVAAIDKLWARAGDKQRPISRFFFDQYVNDIYAESGRQGRLFAVLCGVAVTIAVLGLFGLSAFTAERRTKEIGIRKAMGAGRVDIVRAMIWDFIKPVLWANAIAWPAAYVIAQRWLEGFATHISLTPGAFLAASGVAVAIAVLTVIGHALVVSRAEPVTALRYE